MAYKYCMSYEVTEMTYGKLANNLPRYDLAWFIDEIGEEPMDIRDSHHWIEAQRKNKKVYVLERLSKNGTMGG